MNDTGKAYVIQRLGDCDTLDGLKRVWKSLGREYQNDPDIAALKDRLKASMTDD